MLQLPLHSLCMRQRDRGDFRESRIMKLGFIGLGNMGKAVLEGILKSGIVAAEDIVGSDAYEGAIAFAAEKYHINVTNDNREVASKSDTIVLAVKPQFLAEVLTEIAPYITRDTLFISMAAGKTTAWIHAVLDRDCRVVRIMPNTAAMVGESCTAVCKGQFATDSDAALAVKICESFGTAQVISEKLIDVFSAVGSSSGAFAFLYMEALADGAVANGMPRAMAYEVAAQATLGAAKLMRETKEHPGVLKDMVCSPGGTTIQGIKALEKGTVRGSVMDAVDACVTKSKEL